MISIEINYLAVLVSGFAAMPIGALWYGPLFGKAWMKELGLTEDSLKKNFNPGKAYGLTFIGHLLIALVIAYLLSITGAKTAVDSFRISLAVWLGFIFSTMLITSQFQGKSVKLVVIDSFYHLADCIVFGLILTLWR